MNNICRSYRPTYGEAEEVARHQPGPSAPAAGPRPPTVGAAGAVILSNLRRAGFGDTEAGIF